MIKPKPVNLNLASHPLKNMRLFYSLLSLLGMVLFLVSFKAGSIFLTYRSKVKTIKASIVRIDRSIHEAQRKERQHMVRIENTAKRNKEMVDLINDIIIKKSFSWTDFFSCLENSLPDSSYIVSLTPSLTKDSKMQVRFKVVSQSLKDLLELINNLKALKFKQIKVLGEVKSEQGLSLSEISLTYERNI